LNEAAAAVPSRPNGEPVSGCRWRDADADNWIIDPNPAVREQNGKSLTVHHTQNRLAFQVVLGKSRSARGLAAAVKGGQWCRTAREGKEG
jgi:hypothetical protein